MSHKFPCDPSVSQQIITNKSSGKYVSNISDYATWTIIGLLKENPNSHSSTLKSFLRSNFPNKLFVTNQDVYNTKVRCFRLMNVYNESNKNFDLFQEK